MAQSRLSLQSILETLQGSDPEDEIETWFQKPLNTSLTPPYIVYDIDDEWVERADNKVYSDWNRYSVTVVVRDPDSPIPGLVRGLTHARFNRKFIAAGLHHFVYTLYF